ncbi:MAG: NUDIX hydrolase [Candidatus Niyogibacteria bacterium]|nr:NUDIX hydrolase [Candidatus Niyogibacteria bacterium]
MPKTRKQKPLLRFAVLAVDAALFTLHDKQLWVRLIRVHRPPYFRNAWGFPGGLIHPDETAEDAVHRHLNAKAHIAESKLYMEQLHAFSAVDRDPRGRVVSVAYLALTPWDALSRREKNDAPDARWVPADDTQTLAYDHNEILTAALTRLSSRAASTTILSAMMPDEFTLTEIEHAYELVVKKDLDKRNFRKKILKLKILAPLSKKRAGERARPAALYRFASPRVVEINAL